MIVNAILALVLTVVFTLAMFALIWPIINAAGVMIMSAEFLIIFGIAYSFVDHMRNG